MADSQRIARVKTRTKTLFFEEILINNPLDYEVLQSSKTTILCYRILTFWSNLALN